MAAERGAAGFPPCGITSHLPPAEKAQPWYGHSCIFTSPSVGGSQLLVVPSQASTASQTLLCCSLLVRTCTILVQNHCTVLVQNKAKCTRRPSSLTRPSDSGTSLWGHTSRNTFHWSAGSFHATLRQRKSNQATGV